MTVRTVFSCTAAALALLPFALYAQPPGREPGKSIGTVSVRGNLIVLTLNESALGKQHLFNLAHHTLRFTPGGSGYRAENVPFQWDGNFGTEMTSSEGKLQNFAFPFSGQDWNSFSVGITGSITFGGPVAGGRGGRAGGPGGFGRGGGLSVDRYALLQETGRALVNTVPAIAVFFKPRMLGKRYIKELEDRAVVTWDLTEPHGGIQDWTWVPTVNRFQAVLHKDGTIDLSYDEVAAKDAVVGIYPIVKGGEERELASIAGESNATAAPNLDIKSVKLSAVDGLFVKAAIETRGPVLAEGDPAIDGVTYRLCFSASKPAGDCTQETHADAVWTIRGVGGRGFGGRGRTFSPRYFVSGTGSSSTVKIQNNTISIEGTLPQGFKPGEQVFVYGSSQAPGTPPQLAARIGPRAVTFKDVTNPEVRLSTITKESGPYPVIFEAFYHYRAPRPNDLTCSVIKAIGDNFDMLAYYSDFRIDNPEAGTPSTGPLGGGPDHTPVTGIGESERDPANFCSAGRFQWQYVQPVYVGANQMQEYPPEGVSDPSTRDIISYKHELAERTSNGKIPPYDYAMSQIGHEMGHRWSAFVRARVGNETIELGPTHWARGLQAQVAFPYQRPVEASAMGGGVWQDNYDGTFTQLDDDYYVPATGWSYLDLYLMGLIAPSEVPDFFILRNLEPVGKDANGHPIFKADRTKITVQDVIAVEGPRQPDVDHSQKKFNTGMVVVVEHGKQPSKELLERTEGIRLRWMDYWETTTGHRSSMTTNAR